MRSTARCLTCDTEPCLARALHNRSGLLREVCSVHRGIAADPAGTQASSGDFEDRNGMEMGRTGILPHQDTSSTIDFLPVFPCRRCAEPQKKSSGWPNALIAIQEASTAASANEAAALRFRGLSGTATPIARAARSTVFALKPIRFPMLKQLNPSATHFRSSV